jgi:hypothetical protein
MTDFRALCAELLQELEHASAWDYQQALKDQARAALAQPDPQVPGLTDEELLGIEDLQTTWNAQADAFNSWDELGIDEIVWWAQRQALARWGRFAIEPVPVSERLPGKKDCCSLGYFWAIADDDWEKTHIDSMNWQHLKHHGYTHWLPHWALPVPNSN